MPQHRYFQKRQLIPFIVRNERIRASQVRLIDEEGKNAGVVPTQDAIKRAHDAGLDLILITEKVEPPIARIMEYGKYKYELEKKERAAKKKQKDAAVIKGVRLSIRTSGNDFLFKAQTVDKFLAKGYKVRIEMIMRGREKALKNLADKKIEEFVALIKTPHTIEYKPERTPKGLQFMIRKNISTGKEL